MRQIIRSKKKDPLGVMLQDYLKGNRDAYVDVESPDLEMWKMTGEIMFRPYAQMTVLERKALSLCRDRVLDVGAGAGCHAVYLQKRLSNVDIIDISPGCVEVMQKRGLRSVSHQNLFQIEDRLYDTVLMLMNGIGICGNIDGLNLFFQFIPDILAENGQILIDSTDLAALYEIETDTVHADPYYGETQFVMSYGPIKSDPFDWLYIDFDTLKFHAGINGFKCEKIFSDASHRFLAKMTRD